MAEMTSLVPSSSDGGREAFDLLHPEVQRWVHDQGWAGLREIQARAIKIVRTRADDVLISASTAAGKTEAAFLPALSEVADGDRSGLGILYVAPLKALINDQFGRLETLCDRLDMPLVRWHGDAPAGPKQGIAARPRGGVVLITPESIEALLCRRPAIANSLLGRAGFIIVDEVHAFQAGPRGIHLASLLRRIDAFASVSARRIGLSATIGDLEAARAWLRPPDPKRVHVVQSSGSHAELRLQVRGHLEPVRPTTDAKAPPDTALNGIAGHLMNTLRGRNALAFGGSRQTVEILTDLLREASESANVPNEFFAHHGNLSKHLREDLEARLKDGRLPTTAVCTSTLELGIDIGSVEAVAQVGAPRSISSLRQRLGRSGRRPGVPAELRIYVIENELGKDPDPLDEMRVQAVRAVAALRLMGQGFIEPPQSNGHLGSPLLHQVLSVICERGGATASVLHKILCGPGPFATVSTALFLNLLRGMGSPEAKLLEQSQDGTLMLGRMGERVTSGRDFYAMFTTPEEWRVVTSGKTLGSLPISQPLLVGNLLVFAGRRWIIREADEAAKVVTVDPHKGGRPPRFEGGVAEPVHNRVAEEMLAVYRDRDEPSWLSDAAREFLREGRRGFERLGLGQRSILVRGQDVHLFTWRGSRSNSLLGIILGSSGLRCWAHDFGVVVSRPDQGVLERALQDLVERGPPDLLSLAADLQGLATGKYDGLLAPEVLRQFWALSMDDVLQGIRSDMRALRSITQSSASSDG